MLLADMLTEILHYALRGGAALAGAFIGWFLSKPLLNSLSRLAFQRPIAKEILPLFRGICAAGLGILFFFLIPAAGLGPGLGPGEGPGKGFGAGRDKVKDGPKEKFALDLDKERLPAANKRDDPGPDLIRVEILGGARYPGDEKWYLLQRKDPPLNKTELKERIRDYLKSADLKSARMQPVVTPDTRFDWEATRGPELREIRQELGLQPVDPEEPNLEMTK